MGIQPVIQYKTPVDDHLIAFLKRKRKELSRINEWGTAIIQRLLPFVTAGKTIRGSLVVYTYSMFKKPVPDTVLDAATALELIHSGFLVHDDIMDRDMFRRGQKAMHAQYGENVAICVGDLLFFLGYELLSAVDRKLAAIASREFAGVTLGQMQDISGSQKNILTTYTYKTARYTFSLPFMVGASLAGVPSLTVSKLERLGEALGLLYQIRDDELDHEVDPWLNRQKPRYHKLALQILRTLPIDHVHKKALSDVLTFVETRKR